MYTRVRKLTRFVITNDQHNSTEDDILDAFFHSDVITVHGSCVATVRHFFMLVNLNKTADK